MTVVSGLIPAARRRSPPKKVEAARAGARATSWRADRGANFGHVPPLPVLRREVPKSVDDSRLPKSVDKKPISRARQNGNSWHYVKVSLLDQEVTRLDELRGDEEGAVYLRLPLQEPPKEAPLLIFT
jgi:hypothetical protein